MKVIKINEAIENLDRVINADNSKIQAVTELDPVMADAYNDSVKADEAVEKEMKDAVKELEDGFDGAPKQPKPKKPEEAKIELEESLFEDVEAQPLTEAVEELTEDITDGEPGRSFAADVYNALADVAAKYNGDIHDLPAEEQKAWFAESIKIFMNRFFIKNANESLNEDTLIRMYSDMLADMIETEAVDAKQIATDLIYWCSEQDIERYMQVNDLIPDEDIEEALDENKPMSYDEAKDFMKEKGLELDQETYDKIMGLCKTECMKESVEEINEDKE